MKKAEMVEKLALTDKQEKAFKEFEKSYKKCKKSGIKFYVVLETMTALNGKHLESIACDDDFRYIREKDDSRTIETDEVNNPTIFDSGFAGFADDTHYAILKP